MPATQIPPEIAIKQPPPTQPTSQEPFYAPARPAPDQQDPRNLLLGTLDFHRSPNPVLVALASGAKAIVHSRADRARPARAKCRQRSRAPHGGSNVESSRQTQLRSCERETSRMTIFEHVPPLSWEILREMMVRGTGRAESWVRAGLWALDVLRTRLGDDWPAEVARKNPSGGAPQLAWASGHVVAYAEVLELALRLELLGDVAGIAKVRRVLRTDPRPAQLLHSEMQLEVAGLALSSGMTPELEPASSQRPADVAFAIDDQRLVVETRAMLTSDDWRGENDWNDGVFERIRQIEMAHGIRCEGEISVFLDEHQIERLLREIETRARLVAMGMDPPELREPGVGIEIVPQAQAPAAGLRGPELHGDSWARIAPRIWEKAQAAVDSGANWLRVDARDGLWQFTEWSTRPLADKLQAFATAVRGLLGGLHGIVVSCGPVLRQGTFSDESVELGPGLAAMRRCLPFIRVRETLVIASDPLTAPAAECWVRLYDEEPSWLDWALGEVGLPSTAEILSQ